MPPMMFLHCARCLKEKTTPNLAVGPDESGENLVVWCDNHDELVSSFKLKEPLRNLVCSECGTAYSADKPHKH